MDIQAGRVDLFSQRIRMSEMPCWAAGGRDADGFWIFAVELVRKRRTGSAGGLCGRALRDFPRAVRGGGLGAWNANWSGDPEPGELLMLVNKG